MVHAAISARCSTVLAVATLLGACTSLLGIDEPYANERPTTTGIGGRDTGAGGALREAAGRSGNDVVVSIDSGISSGGRGNVVGTGGASQPSESGGTGETTTGSGGAGGTVSTSGGSTGGASTGGTPVNGGKAGSGGATGSAGALGSAGAGGTQPEIDAGAVECPTGTFSGRYTGTHKPSSGLSAVPAKIGGDIMLHLVTSTHGHVAVTGTFDDRIDPSMGGIRGNFSGTLDCAQRTGKATLDELTTTVVTIIPTFVGPVGGTVDISVDEKGVLSGTFSIHEPNPLAVGSGNWSANRTGN